MPVASHHQELDEGEIHPQVLLCSFLWKTGLFCTTLPLLSLHHFLLRTEIPSFISATSDTFMKLQSCFKTRFRITKSCFYVLDVFLVTAVCFQHCLEKIEESKLFPSLLFGDKHWDRIKIRECSVESTFYLHLKNQPLERLKVVRNEKKDTHFYSASWDETRLKYRNKGGSFILVATNSYQSTLKTVLWSVGANSKGKFHINKWSVTPKPLPPDIQTVPSLYCTISYCYTVSQIGSLRSPLTSGKDIWFYNVLCIMIKVDPIIIIVFEIIIILIFKTRNIRFQKHRIPC